MEGGCDRGAKAPLKKGDQNGSNLFTVIGHNTNHDLQNRDKIKMETITIILLSISILLSIATGQQIHCEIGEKNAEIQKKERTNKDTADLRPRENHDETSGAGN